LHSVTNSRNYFFTKTQPNKRFELVEMPHHVAMEQKFSGSVV